jgi:hypothetical protein
MADSRIPNLNAADSRLAEHVFEFVQFLLDDDANLTPAGNLTGAARQKLRGRLNELIAAENSSGETSESENEVADPAAGGEVES